MRATSRFKLLHVLSALAGALLLAVATSASAATAPEVCKKCHEDQYDSYAASIHGQKGNLKGPSNAGGCETCHGNAEAHVKAKGGRGVGGILGFDNKAITAEKKSGVCLTCHEGNRNLTFWDSGKHKKNDVACSNCHSIHGGNILKKTDPSVSPYVTTVRQLQYETCVTCHRQVRSQLLKTSHHPIVEGKLKCSDCHNPHGALSHAMVKNESVNQLCSSCHAEKRGPFIWEHPPVEENCLTCHNSHGSNHNKLLNERVPNLCQDCHDWSRHPGSFYSSSGGWAGTANTRLIARGCVNCHSEIHGSNAPGNYGQKFVR